MPFTLTWTHGTAAEVISFTVAQQEGDAAQMSIVVRNPHTSLLPSQTATLSDENGTIFFGRLMAVPDNIHEDFLELVFLAKPNDLLSAKQAAAEEYMEEPSPVYDPVFIAPERRADPDVLLEADTWLWHIDRITHEVTLSDIIVGTPVTISADMVYDRSVKIRFTGAPQLTVNVEAEVQWRQKAKGVLDYTNLIVTAAGGEDGHIFTLTGGGLISGWPKPGDNVGGGWSVANAFARRNEALTSLYRTTSPTGGFEGNDRKHHDGLMSVILPLPYFNVVFGGFADGSTGGTDGDTYTSEMPRLSSQSGYTPYWPNYYQADRTFIGNSSSTGWPIWGVEVQLKLQFDMDRERKEYLTFSVDNDVQDVVPKSEDHAAQTIQISSSEVDQPIDPEGARPIGTVKARFYFPSDRGHLSIQYLANLARARLRASARCAEVSFNVPFAVGRALSLTNSVLLTHASLPGGAITGKVKALTFGVDAESGEAGASVTLGCAVGTAAVIASPGADTESYATGYSDSYTVLASAVIINPGEAFYIPAPPIPIIDEDEFDPFNLEIENTLAEEDGIVVTGNQSAQQTAVAGKATSEGVSALNALPTKVTMLLKAVNAEVEPHEYNLGGASLTVPEQIQL